MKYLDPRSKKTYNNLPKGDYLPNGLHKRFLIPVLELGQTEVKVDKKGNLKEVSVKEKTFNKMIREPKFTKVVPNDNDLEKVDKETEEVEFKPRRGRGRRKFTETISEE